MLLEIRQLGDPVLRQKSRTISHTEPDLDHLVTNMLESMEAAEGVGLAAPQIGLSIRLVVIDVPFEDDSTTLFKVNGEDDDIEEYLPMVLINPEIVELSGKKVPFNEGCLSILNFRGIVHRPEQAKVKFTQMDGTAIEVEANGILARIFQHEIDHLNGILFVDRLSSAQKMTLKQKLAKLGLPIVPKAVPEEEN